MIKNKVSPAKIGQGEGNVWRNSGGDQVKSFNSIDLESLEEQFKDEVKLIKGEI